MAGLLDQYPPTPHSTLFVTPISLTKPPKQSSYYDSHDWRERPVLRLAAADEQPAHEAVDDGHGKTHTQRLGHQGFVASDPNEGHQRADGEVADAPNPHQRVVELLGLRLGMQWKTQAFEMRLRTECGI